MSYKEIKSTCAVRVQSGLSCRECIYKGRICDTFCAKHNIVKPSDYKEDNNYGNKQGKSS